MSSDPDDGIAPGPDGNLWFTDEGHPTAVGRITPGGQIAEFSSGLSPSSNLESGIAPGPDGNLWFADGGTPAIGRITSSGEITEYTSGLGSGGDPYGIAPGPDGNLWFTTANGAPNAIGRITPGGQITEFTSGLNPNSHPVGVAPGPDGNLWFTDEGCHFGGTCAIGRITPGGQITEYTSGLPPGSDPYGIAPGPDGNLWFADAGTPAIGRITPSGEITEYTSGLGSGSRPYGIAAGPDGNLWFTDAGTTPAIGRITPSGQITEYTSGLNSGSRPFWIAPGADGSLWFTDPGSTVAIGRIGSGAPAALASPLTVSGGGQVDTTQMCSASWSTWAGQQPSTTLHGFDGYRWLLDGSQVASGASYTPAAASIGHRLSCSETVTYPLLDVTTSATSAPIPVVAPVAPVVRSARESAKRWREGGRLAQISKSRRKKKLPLGTTFSFSLNEQASVSFSFTQRATGRKVGRRCVAKRRKSQKQMGCRRSLTVGALSFAGHSGTNKVVFQGRLSHSKKLRPGHYTLVIMATLSTGQKSAPQKLSFVIVK